MFLYGVSVLNKENDVRFSKLAGYSLITYFLMKILVADSPSSERSNF